MGAMVAQFGPLVESPLINLNIDVPFTWIESGSVLAPRLVVGT